MKKIPIYPFTAALFAVALLILFRHSFRSDLALFANDGPLSLLLQSEPGGFSRMLGSWDPLHFLGLDTGAQPVALTTIVQHTLGPMLFLKWMPVIALAALGAAMGYFLHSEGLPPLGVAIGALGTALGSDFFSYACWGLPTLPLSAAWAVASLTAVAKRRWVLAGVCLGQSLMEGFDNGAIFSLLVGAFAFVRHGWKRAAKGLALTAPISALVAIQILVTTALPAVRAGMAGSVKGDRASEWAAATQWSLPPAETLRFVFAGLYGYRMDDPHNPYRGRVGSHADDPTGESRFSGAGHYAGFVIVILAFIGGLMTDRKIRWFWLGVLLFGVLAAWGRYFPPVFEAVRVLPGFDSIRNPIKFLHLACLAIPILAAYSVFVLPRMTPVVLVAIAVDLSFFNMPWVVHYPWKNRLEMNDPVVEFLARIKSSGYRVTRVPLTPPPGVDPTPALRSDAIASEWAQHQFPYRGIETLDVVQLPRPPQDVREFTGAVGGNPLRYWTLTGARYLIAPTGALNLPNVVQSPLGVSLYIHEGAMPRASVFMTWRNAPRETILRRIAEPDFDPRRELIVEDTGVMPPEKPEGFGTATYRRAMGDIVVDTPAPCLLLVLDRWTPDWRAFVDGQPTELIRANGIFRAVPIPAGQHFVWFKFAPPTWPTWCSILFMLLCLPLIFIRNL